MQNRKLSCLLGSALLGLGLAQPLFGQPPRLPAEDPNVGRPAPELQVSEWIGDKSVAAADLAGRPYVLELWATWCGPCRQTIPHLNQLAQIVEPFGMAVIGLTEEDAEVVRPFVRDHGMIYHVGIDQGTEAGLEYQGIPFAAVVDADGQIAWAGHPLNPEFSEQVISLAEAHVPAEFAAAFGQARQGALGAAYEMLGEDESAAAAVIRARLMANFEAAREFAGRLEGAEQYIVLQGIGEAYAGLPGDVELRERMQALAADDEVQAALENQRIGQGLEREVLDLRTKLMERIDSGAIDQTRAMLEYGEQLLPLFERFVADHPEHPISRELADELPGMRRELEQVRQQAAEPEDQ